MTALPEPGLLTGQDLDALGAEFRRRHRCLIVRGALAKPVLEGLLAALPALRPGVHRMTFFTGDWFAAEGVQGFYPLVTVVCTISDPAAHHHIPLLISPYGYSTYRGS